MVLSWVALLVFVTFAAAAPVRHLGPLCVFVFSFSTGVPPPVSSQASSSHCRGAVFGESAPLVCVSSRGRFWNEFGFDRWTRPQHAT